MKTPRCEQCLFNDHETIECAVTQLRWALENFRAELPVIGRLFDKESRPCDWFEPKEEES